uniref:Androgen dependent TFPI regulating protein n=1 Tax=Saimiri boliviensis boliviensis TaxID=39432 RepID=A0A2K6UFF8_SAIBB
MTKTFTCIYHFLVLSWYIFLNYYVAQNETDKVKSKIFAYGGKWKYMTLLNMLKHRTAGFGIYQSGSFRQLLQTIFYGVACLDDVLKRIRGRKDMTFLTAFRDLLFTTLAFPISTFVFLAFWILFLYNRNLVYPKALDTVFPMWLNHAMHTLILPITLTEVILRQHSYPSKKTGLTLLAAGSFAYISRILWIYFETGTWVYPLLAKLSPVGLAAVFSLSYIFIASIYLLGEKLNHWKWGDMMQPRKKRK